MKDTFLDQQVLQAVALALEEDKAQEDITSQACIDRSTHVHAQLLLKQRATIAGLAFLPCILKEVGVSLFSILVQEGGNYEASTILACIEGDAHVILKIERTLLNLIQHTSGIATLTAQFVQAVEGYPCAILDTRKTLPGLRAIQKYAVRIGGGKNHRFDLKERVLIKNTHLSILNRIVENPIKAATEKARLQSRLQSKDVAIEIEINNLEMLQEALDAKPDAILLDNMSPESVAEAVRRTERTVYLEASGGITLSNVRAYAQTGVDAVSIGALTHSAPAVDISLRM